MPSRLSAVPETSVRSTPRWRAFLSDRLASSSLRLMFCISLPVLLSACGVFTQNVAYKPVGFTVDQPVLQAAPGALPSGSSVTANSAHSPAAQPQPRKIAVFFDGTANDEGSDTNVKRLHSLVSLQDRGDIATLYVVGVGDGIDGIGKVTGAGINARVMLGYEFILNHYQPAGEDRPADEIYIFGFSRGAYAARILTTMLHYGGRVRETVLPGAMPKLTPQEISQEVHKAVFPGFMRGNAQAPSKRFDEVSRVLSDKGLSQAPSGDGRTAKPSVPVRVLGLWDTVQALGFESTLEALWANWHANEAPPANVDEPNRRYGERLCNVEQALHAVSLDDDRATVFTPLLISRAHLFDGCEANMGMLDSERRILKGRLQEVWFSGAHSDVGGGYASGALAGVSLNWMVEQIRCTGLLPNSLCKLPPPVRVVREDPLGGSHDPIHGIFKVYPRNHRDVVQMASDTRSIWRGDTGAPASVCVHPAVFERRRLIDPAWHESDQLLLNSGPQTVELVRADYGMGKRWSWLKQRRSSDEGHTLERFRVEAYPDCLFMNQTVKVPQ